MHTHNKKTAHTNPGVTKGFDESGPCWIVKLEKRDPAAENDAAK